jgi:gamma-glutamyltranspeptidase
LPVLVQRDSRMEVTAGTMGGYGQPQINAVNLIRTLDLGMSPLEAISAPRWLVGGMDADEGGHPFVLSESGVPETTREVLRRAGFDVRAVGGHDEVLGHAHLIRVGSAGFDVGSDPRADGGALAN